MLFQFYKRFNFEKQFVSTTLINSSIAISSYGINFHYDAGGYHLLNQNWILNNKIILQIGQTISAELIWKSDNTIEVTKETAEKLFKLLDTLEDNEDTQTISSNFEVSEDILASLT